MHVLSGIIRLMPVRQKVTAVRISQHGHSCECHEGRQRLSHILFLLSLQKVRGNIAVTCSSSLDRRKTAGGVDELMTFLLCDSRGSVVKLLDLATQANSAFHPFGVDK